MLKCVTSGGAHFRSLVHERHKNVKVTNLTCLGIEPQTSDADIPNHYANYFINHVYARFVFVNKGKAFKAVAFNVRSH